MTEVRDRRSGVVRTEAFFVLEGQLSQKTPHGSRKAPTKTRGAPHTFDTAAL